MSQFLLVLLQALKQELLLHNRTLLKPWWSPSKPYYRSNLRVMGILCLKSNLKPILKLLTTTLHLLFVPLFLYPRFKDSLTIFDGTLITAKFTLPLFIFLRWVITTGTNAFGGNVFGGCCLVIGVFGFLFRMTRTVGRCRFNFIIFMDRVYWNDFDD